MCLWLQTQHTNLCINYGNKNAVLHTHFFYFLTINSINNYYITLHGCGYHISSEAWHPFEEYQVHWYDPFLALAALALAALALVALPRAALVMIALSPMLSHDVTLYWSP